MKKDPHIIERPHGAGIGSLKSYGLGFILSALLTLAAFASSYYKLFTGGLLVAIVVGFGTLQLVIQLILFIHINIDTRPRWNTIVFFFMLLIGALVVLGSLWIMASLDYRLMDGEGY